MMEAFQWTGKRVVAHKAVRDEQDIEEQRAAETIIGTALGEPVLVDQDWLPVKWDDREDPDWFKLGCIRLAPERSAVQQPETVAMEKAWAQGHVGISKGQFAAGFYAGYRAAREAKAGG